MADLSFDVVIVGGGVKGLSTGMYLAKYGGMSVGVFEATHELGGGLAGDQTAPGFQANTHISGQCSWYYNSVIKDDLPEIWEEGFKQHGYANTVAVSLFDNDTCLAMYAQEQDADLTRSAAQIARFSEEDAETYMKLGKVYRQYLEPALFEEAFSVASPVGVPGPLAKALSNPEVAKVGIDPHTAAMSPVQALRTFFESEEVAALLLRSGTVTGQYIDEAGIGLSVLANAYDIGNRVTTYGGAHNLAHAMHRVLYRYGAKTHSHSEVAKAIIEDGTAKGIELTDGTRVEAKTAVLSTLSPRQLCYDLIGPDHVSPRMLRKIDALETHRVCTFIATWALTEYPQWKAHDFNPDIDSKEIFSGLPTYTIGGKGVASLLEETAYLRMQKTHPHPTMMVKVYPPEARLSPGPEFCQIGTTILTPPAWAHPEEWWIKYQHEILEWVMSQLQQYTTNINWDKVIGVLPVTPHYVAKHFKNMAPSGNWQIIDMIPSQMGSYRPIPELAQHRTPVKNLYATGSGFGNWGVSSFCTSYTCYKVMSEDLGLRMPWKEQGRPY